MAVRGREFKFYPAIKQLTLDLAATSFLGAQLGPELERCQARLHRYGRGRDRRYPRASAGHADGRAAYAGGRCIVDYFNRQIPLRRERGGDDLFSQLCRATWDDGSLLSNADIVDHMSFLMMAAHDTLTSSLTSFIYRLAANPDWQEKVREEVRGLSFAETSRCRSARLDELV